MKFSVHLYEFCYNQTERGINPNIENYTDALWWSLITMTTIGYGDIVPITSNGKIIGFSAIILGYVMFAIPAGIIGTGFALKIRENSKIKHHQKKRQVNRYSFGYTVSYGQSQYNCCTGYKHYLSRQPSLFKMLGDYIK